MTQLENVADVYSLTPTQQGMLFHTVSASENGVYLVQMAVTIEGDIDPDRLTETLQVVCSKHDALRSFFIWDGVEQPLQVVSDAVEFPVQRLDWRNDSAEAQRQNLISLVETNKQAGIDTAEAPLLKFSLCQCDDSRYVLLFTCHHLVLDGWSTRALLTEILEHYDSPSEEAPVFQFRSYMEWIANRDVDGEREFWNSELAGFSEPNQIGPPTALPDQSSAKSEVESVQASCRLSVEQTKGLRELARSSQVTLSTVVRALWSLTVSRFSGGGNDVVFGVTVAGRPPSLEGIESGIGSFINTIPFRTTIDGDQSLSQWLQQIQRSNTRTSQWETSSLLEIQKNADVPAGTDLFESILVFENFPQRDADSTSISVVGTEHFEQSNYPLALLVVPTEAMELIFVHDQTRFSAPLIERMMEQITWLVDQMVAQGQQNIGLLRGLPATQGLMVGAADEKPDTRKFIDRLFSEHASANGGDAAVVFNGSKLSYGELEQKSNQVANFLVEAGVGPNQAVGICVDRSMEMIVGILGVLKSGAAYVPIDTGYPQEHIEHVVRDAKIALVLTTANHSKVLPDDAVSVLFENALSDVVDVSSPKPPQERSLDDLAYLIYTSGSTGVPKGVQITHANLAYSTWARTQHYGNSAGVFLLLSSFAFDSSVAGIFGTLATGGALVLPEPNQEKDAQAIVGLIREHRVTQLLCLPALYQLLLEADSGGQLQTLKTAIVAGESLSPRVVETHFANSSGELHNEYGPTEATVWATVYQVRKDDLGSVIPIGMPIAGSTIAIVDEQFQPVGWGAVGEICIGGPGLARGYLNQPELTAEKFIDVSLNGQASQLMYRTGDLGYRRDDGQLIFAGRIDRQIKIRGHRIELGAVEAALASAEEVTEVCVTGWSSSASNPVSKLIACYTGSLADEGRLKELAASKLPHYMVPDRIIHLDCFPRLANGKIDETSLPGLVTLGNTSSELVAPRNQAERLLLEIWQETLGVPEIGIHEDFFAAGGDSMSSIRLISEARKAGLPLKSPAVLVENSTIAKLAALVSSDKGDQNQSDTVIRFNDCEFGMPIVCVHSGGKHAMYFQALAKYFPSRPFIAVQSKGLNGGPRAQSVEEVAADYLGEIENLFGDRPVHLVGYCKGARITLEMVHQLESAGKQIGAWTVVDSDADAPRISMLEQYFKKHRTFAKVFPRYAYWAIRNALSETRSWLYRNWLLISGEENRRVLYQTLVELKSRSIHHAYTPAIVNSPLMLVRSTEHEEKELHLDWARFISLPNGVDNRVVNGIHDAMVVEPAVRNVAEIIRQQSSQQ